MYNGSIIKELLKARNIPNKELLKFLGYDNEGGNTSLSQIVNGNPTVRRLEPIADFFGVSMDVFFERGVAFERIDSSTDTDKVKIEYLEKIIEEKEKHIQTLQQFIDVMNKKS